MSQEQGIRVADARRLLVDRVAASPHFSRSARLRDLLLYLAQRVLDEDACEIHEQEVGCRVFGRAPDYDTAADNIVRVHASMLRKRLEQYFAGPGADEAIILEIPKGNYAPVFRERPRSMPGSLAVEPPRAPQKRPADWRLAAALLLAAIFAGSTAFLLLRASARPEIAAGPTVRMLWSQIFTRDRATDVVVDDAAVGLYQELTGHPISLAEYYDRSYLRGLGAAGGALDAQSADSLVLRRQSSSANVSFLWRVLDIARGNRANLRFARDYSFRELKADSAILLGNPQSNPWLQPFESKLGIRWKFAPAEAVYYPVDTWQANRGYGPGQPGEAHQGYFSIALVPNLGGAGAVLLVSATGGSAMNAAAEFLLDERSLAGLRRTLPTAPGNAFPPFEALVRVGRRSTQPRDAAVVLSRAAAK